jgi:tetratricopeptide (TPR) repeat protein
MVKKTSRVAFLQGKTDNKNSRKSEEPQLNETTQMNEQYHGNEEIPRILQNVFLRFKEGLFDEAIELLEEVLKIDFEYKGVTTALKCATFWSERKKKLVNINERFERAEFLLSQWDFFTQFLNHIGETSERCLYGIKQFAFGNALKLYLEIFEDSGFYDADLLLKLGRCYKVLGNFDKAIEYLGIANQQRSGNAVILAELADCYSLINEMRISKALFREAFFIDPEAIHLAMIDSGMIQNLIKKCLEKGIKNEDLNRWIPVYGTIYGVFTIKRELRPLEFGKLRQSIYALEKEMTGEFGKTAEFGIIEKKKPILINHYFWLIDHYICTGEDSSKIEEVLQKLKYIDPNIYHEYIQ